MQYQIVIKSNIFFIFVLKFRSRSGIKYRFNLRFCFVLENDQFLHTQSNPELHDMRGLGLLCVGAWSYL